MEGDSFSGSDDGSQESYPRSRGRRALCPSKNAILARENRIRKKKYVNTLEKQMASLKAENARARAVADTQVGYIADLKAEIRYLRSVLANSKEIGFLVRKIRSEPETPNLANLASSTPPAEAFDGPFSDLFDFPPDDKLRSDSGNYSDHNYTANFDANGVDGAPEDVGVCLHVSKNNMSLEFCSVCNERAIKNWDFDHC